MSDKKSKLPLRVLYVEDEEIIREEMASFLKRRVEHLILAHDGVDGLEKYRTHQPDIVVTDLRMPGMTGLEMAEAIRGINPLCPIIVTTAISDMDTLFESIRVGIDRYLVKPIQMKDLTEALEKSAVKLEKLRTFTGNPEMIPLTEVERRSMEQKTESEVARLVKTLTGKGPKSVKAFVQGNLVTLQLYETRTPYERVLLRNSENARLVDFARETFYKGLQGELLQILRTTARCSVVMDSIRTDSVMDLDEILLVMGKSSK